MFTPGCKAGGELVSDVLKNTGEKGMLTLRSAMNAESRYELLFEMSLAFSAAEDLEALISSVVDRCKQVFHAEGFSVLLHDSTRDELYFPFIVSERDGVAETLSQLRFSADQGVAGEVLRSGIALRIDQAAEDPRVLQPTAVLPEQKTRSLLCAPLRTIHGNIGVVEAVNRLGPEPFSDDDLRFLEAISGSIALAIENLRLADHLRGERDRLSRELVEERRQGGGPSGFGKLFGSSAAMQEIFELLESAAALPIAVLVRGETGTGKELAARALHDAGPRASQPFLAVNCGALPENLLESELFGHRKGAFTGADENRIGLFEAAKGGTLFLDELGEMPIRMQSKLLRVLQEKEVLPLGEHQPRAIDVRVVAATNRDLEQEIEAGNFREDLYYRLAAFPVMIPPLRARRSDIAGLATHLLARIGEDFGQASAELSAEAIAALESYDWPGNVRELRNELERAVVLSRGGAVEAQHLSARVRGDAVDDRSSGTEGESDLRRARAAFEARFIQRSLREHGGNVTQTAAVLGLSRVGLQKKIKELGLEREPR